jgi:hypothetical protein
MSRSEIGEKQVQIRNGNSDNSLEPLFTIAREKGFGTEENKDYGAGPIDLVWNITNTPCITKDKVWICCIKSRRRRS